MLLRSLQEEIDYLTPTGRMLAGIFASLAAYERELMHERAAAARAAARPGAGIPDVDPGCPQTRCLRCGRCAARLRHDVLEPSASA